MNLVCVCVCVCVCKPGRVFVCACTHVCVEGDVERGNCKNGCILVIVKSPGGVRSGNIKARPHYTTEND